MKTNIRSIAVLVSVIWPFSVLSDHVPDNLAQKLDPNYVGCIMAVQDAEQEFRDSLQGTCLSRMGDICSGRNGVALPSQVIDCVHFENQRGVNFLETAVMSLPENVEQNGFFGRQYQKRRVDILENLEVLRDQAKPQTIDAAIQQTVTMASAVTMLFWLARKTGTSLEAHVQSTFGNH